MKTHTNELIALVISALAAAALSAPPAAQADDVNLLKQETASLDTITPDQAAKTASIPAPTTTLYGGAKKHQEVGPTAGASDSLKPEKAASDAYTLAVQKLSRGDILTSEEYRSLNIGLAGYESFQTFFQPIAKVTVVYADSPAYKAGIRKGDKLVSEKTDPLSEAKEKANPYKPLWTVTFGKVGDPVTLTVLRHKKPVALTLYKMNMEDIQEPEYRKMWEDTVRKLGYPQSGTYTGENMNSLSESK